MSTVFGGLVTTGYLTTTDVTDTYATHLDNLGRGGVQNVSTIMDRDNIPSPRRSQGMYAYIIDTFEIYQLVGGIENIDWKWMSTFNNETGSYILNTVIDVLPEEIRLTEGKLLKGGTTNLAEEVQRIALTNLPSNSTEHFLYTGDSLGNPSFTIQINAVNETDLEYKHINIGDIGNRRSAQQRITLDNIPTASLLQILGTDLSGDPRFITKIDATNETDLEYKHINIGDIGNRRSAQQRVTLDNLPTSSNHSLLSADSSGLPQFVIKIDNVNLPDLQFKFIEIGDVSNRRLAQQRVTLENIPIGAPNKVLGTDGSGNPTYLTVISDANLPDLQYKFIEIGDINNRRVAQQRFTIDQHVSLSLSAGPGINAGEIVRGSFGGIPVISDDLTILEGSVRAINIVIIPAINARITAVELVNDVQTAAIGGIVGTLYALHGSGFVDFPPVDLLAVDPTLFKTVRGADCTLDKIPAEADVDFSEFRIKNIAQSPTEDLDAVSLRFLWDLIHSKVDVVFS